MYEDESETPSEKGFPIGRRGHLFLFFAFAPFDFHALQSGVAPLDYADTEPGAREVEDLLGRIAHGVFS